MVCNIKLKNKKEKICMDYEKTNSVTLSGTISQKPVFSHQLLGGEAFYDFYLDVARLSGAVDSIPVTISQRLLKSSGIKFEVGTGVSISGEFRSHNLEQEGKSKLLLSVLCKEVAEKAGEDENCIELTGFICKPPIFRETPFKRQINDILLAVNRPVFKRSDYIPVIAWGRNALYAKNFRVGDMVKIKGRIQSRKFNKVIDGETIEKTAYEVSVQDILQHEEKLDTHISFEEKEMSM